MSASAGWQNWSSGCSPGGAVTFTWGTGGGLPSSVSGIAANLAGAPAGRAASALASAGWPGPFAVPSGWPGPPAASVGWAGPPAALPGWAGPAAAPLAVRPELSRDTPALAVSTHRTSAAMANVAPFAPPFPAGQIHCCRDYGPILMPGVSRWVRSGAQAGRSPGPGGALASAVAEGPGGMVELRGLGPGGGPGAPGGTSAPGNRPAHGAKAGRKGEADQMSTGRRTR